MFIIEGIVSFYDSFDDRRRQGEKIDLAGCECRTQKVARRTVILKCDAVFCVQIVDGEGDI